MTQLNFHNTNSSFNPPQRVLLPILQKVKEAYLLWYEYYQILPKTHRYSLGQRIDSLFAEIMEAIATASFLVRGEKLSYIKLTIRKVDTLKLFLMILWETKSLDNKKYIALSVKIDEIGRMLGGWSGQLQKSFQQTQDKQNSPDKGEK